MPFEKIYKKGAVIYFDKDVGDEIFLLKSGLVSITFKSAETGIEVSRMVKPGEFFGLKSGIIQHRRDEVARTLQDSSVFVFKAAEFERFISAKPSIMLKLLKALSNQLRGLGHKVNTLISKNDVIPPDVGMFKIGDYFLKNRKFEQALTVFKRFKEFYNDSPLYRFVDKRIEIAQKAIETGYVEKFPSADDLLAKLEWEGEEEEEFKVDVSSVGGLMKAVYMAENLIKRNKILEALSILNEIIQQSKTKSVSQDMLEKVYLLKAEAEEKQGDHREAIQIYSEFVKKFQNSKYVKLALFKLANAYKNVGEKESAIALYRKIAAMPPMDDISRKARELSVRSL